MSFNEWKDSELGNIPIEWDVVKIEEIADVVSGGTPSTKNEDYYGGEIAWITPKDLSGYTSKYISKGERNITQLGLENSSAKLLPPNTVLFSSRAPIGYVAISENKLATNQGFKNLVCDNTKVDFQFMYYKMKTLKESLEAVAGGSTFKEVSGKVVKEFKVILPPLKEQKAIANILSSLDEKIELNNQMNKTLEEMAQALFKRWFIDFEFPNEDGEPYKSSGGEMVDSELGMIPKGWKVMELEDLLFNVKHPIKAGEHLKNLPYLPIDTLPMKALSIKEFKSWEEAKSSLILFNKNDILLGAMRVYFHRVCLAPFEGITRTTCFVLRPKDKELHAYLTMQLFDEETINFANSTSKGTTMPYAVWENGLNKRKVIVPTKYINRKFAGATDSILQRIRDSIFENIYLQEVRDALLLKLMSGEIRVLDIEN